MPQNGIEQSSSNSDNKSTSYANDVNGLHHSQRIAPTRPPNSTTRNGSKQNKQIHPPLGDFSPKGFSKNFELEYLPSYVIEQCLEIENQYKNYLTTHKSINPSLWLVVKPLALPLLAYTITNKFREDTAIVIYENEKAIAVNQRAIEKGIKIGMPLNRVLSIIDDCTLIKRRPLLEQRLLKSIALILESYSNEICLNNDNVAFEVGRSLSLFNGLNALVENLLPNLCNKLGYFNIGAALTIQHAIWQAKANEIAQSENTDRHKLHDLPLSFIDIKPKELERLNAMGLYTYGDIKRLPQQLFKERISAELREKLNRANGDSLDSRQRYQRIKQFALKIEFDYPINEIDHLMPIMSWAVKQLSINLNSLNRGVYSLLFGLINTNRHIDWHVVRLTQVVYKYEKLLIIIKNKVQQCVLNSPIDGICLLTGPYQHLIPTTADLFQHSSFKTDNFCDVLLSRLGESALNIISLNKDYLPERQTHFASLVRNHSIQQQSHKNELNLLNPQPVWIYVEPIKLIPQHQIWGEQFVLHHYPNRIDTGWWRNEWNVRDYYLATTETGKRYWIFRQHRTWYAHGQFF